MNKANEWKRMNEWMNESISSIPGKLLWWYWKEARVKILVKFHEHVWKVDDEYYSCLQGERLESLHGIFLILWLKFTISFIMNNKLLTNSWFGIKMYIDSSGELLTKNVPIYSIKSNKIWLQQYLKGVIYNLWASHIGKEFIYFV